MRKRGPGRQGDRAGKEAEGAQLFEPEVWVQNSATCKGFGLRNSERREMNTEVLLPVWQVLFSACQDSLINSSLLLHEASPLLVTTL